MRALCEGAVQKQKHTGTTGYVVLQCKTVCGSHARPALALSSPLSTAATPAHASSPSRSTRSSCKLQRHGVNLCWFLLLLQGMHACLPVCLHAEELQRGVLNTHRAAKHILRPSCRRAESSSKDMQRAHLQASLQRLGRLRRSLLLALSCTRSAGCAGRAVWARRAAS